MNAIEIQSIRKSFNGKPVLTEISGSIEQGKVVGLLGRNGEGKTTLFRILLDMISTDSGSVSVLGMTPNGSGKIRRHVGYIPERPNFHEFMNIEEVFRLRAALFPTWDWRKAQEMAKKLELNLKTSAKDASKGTLSKMAWICATAHNPSVLFLDEPTSGLDPVIRDQVLSQFVHEMTEHGKTILVTNHHMEEMLGVLDQVWILSGGQITARYTLDDLKHSVHHVSGRLLVSTIPKDLSFLFQKRIGELVQWVVVDKNTLHRIQQEHLLDSMEVRPLPLEETFMRLLANTVEPS